MLALATNQISTLLLLGLLASAVLIDLRCRCPQKGYIILELLCRGLEVFARCQRVTRVQAEPKIPFAKLAHKITG